MRIYTRAKLLLTFELRNYYVNQIDQRELSRSFFSKNTFVIAIWVEIIKKKGDY